MAAAYYRSVVLGADHAGDKLPDRDLILVLGLAMGIDHVRDGSERATIVRLSAQRGATGSEVANRRPLHYSVVGRFMAVGAVMQQLSKGFAQYIAHTDVVKFGNFTLKSGRKSDVFINFGNICSGEEASCFGTFFA